MRFIDRKRELKRLRPIIDAEQAKLIIVYGRRRIGKSRLVRQFIREKDIYFMADQSEANRQIELFSKQISTILPGFDKVNYPDWEVIFENLNHRIEKGTIICLDEFPYLVKNAPELPSILQKIWERKEQLNYHLILCGSSQQLMFGLVMDANAPLFGRADEIMKIKPLPISYLPEILPLSPERIIEEYSIWGGIPRYWELRIQENNLEAALNRHVFTSQGILYHEPVHLFLDDMRDTVQSYTLLSIIASGSHRLSEIASRIGKPATSLYTPLSKLIELGYLKKEHPFGVNIKKSKKSLYLIKDPFMDFYFKFVVSNRSLIEVEKPAIISTLIQQKMHQYVAVWWEHICRDVVPLLPIHQSSYGTASRWWGTPEKDKEIELDIVSESTDGKYLLVGECKWNKEALNEKELLNVLRKKAALLPFSKNKEIIPVLFLRTTDDVSNERIFTPEKVIDAYV